MNAQLQKCSFALKDWMVPPILVPLALVLTIAIWVAVRPHLG
ncbi:hypothetical protein CCC_04107 [Paramagnetospirillum magnetotacticum MS-1]|uniref:Uncharacterized protein n=1 Tax=Paramagnetospirillum magnetotacticum MS-1 TaxID=272627 RepID=A0A0C2V3F9_PARME|nr:hypothetical protein [Paramagnetospirillum magnetotacticum]KIL99591.1 hypothetical protein CCC_04107 [Paramagnetospirillum magnetotacticum MS-1]